MSTVFPSPLLRSQTVGECVFTVTVLYCLPAGGVCSHSASFKAAFLLFVYCQKTRLAPQMDLLDSFGSSEPKFQSTRPILGC